MSRFPWGVLVLAALAWNVLATDQIRAAQTARNAPAPAARPKGLVWVVPADGSARSAFSTIAEAIDAAADGDTVLLAPGVFRGPGNRDLLVEGKNLRIEHQGDPDRCVIDAEGLGFGFYFDGDEVSCETLLRGVTIANGNGLRGAGIRCENGASPTIERCIIRDCSAGIGGGISYFTTSFTTQIGRIVDCEIRGNHSTSGGGGLQVAGVDIERCLIIDNTSDFDGAGVNAIGAMGSIRNSIVAGNRWTGTNGRIGGGLSVQEFLYVIENCTIVGNEAELGPGIAFFNGDPTATVVNTILWGNVSPLSPQQVWQMTAFGTSVAPFRYCDIEGGASPGISVFGRPPTVSNIFDVDPLFDPATPEEYLLSPASPLIDMGEPGTKPAPNAADQQREARANGPVDIGADEHWPAPVLTLPTPGRAGERNEWTLRGAGSNTLVLFLTGNTAGSIAPFERCPSSVLGILSPSILGLRRGRANGEVVVRAQVPASAAGLEGLYQAVVLDTASGTCEVTPVVPFVFP